MAALNHPFKLSLVALSLSMLAVPRAGFADEPPPGPYGQPVYPAPLSQTTQSTFVPQSVALSGPEEITDYDETRAAPQGYSFVERSRKHLIVAGAVTFGTTYLVSAFAASVGDDASKGGSGNNELGSLWVPVAGPFMEMGHTDSSTAKFFLAGLGGAQLAGAIMLVYGLSSPQHVLVRNDLLGMSVTPVVSHGHTGLALTGSF